MSSSFGRLFRVSTFGESHGAAIGAVIDGIPSGLEICEADIQQQLDRRRGGGSAIATSRAESDRCEILSGVFEGRATGTPLAVLIRNRDARSGDYEAVAGLYRPGHADFTYDVKYGFRDYRGGGRSSGRETAARVAAGAVAQKLLAEYGVRIIAHTVQIGKIKAKKFNPAAIEDNPVRCADPAAAVRMAAAVSDAARDGDSIGAIVECRTTGIPAGLGEPIFDKLDAELAKAMLSIGAVKGIEFGEGFAVAAMRGSENNDAMSAENGFMSNHAGGILGGISTGEPLVFRIAVKPTPSISLSQQTINRDGDDAVCSVKGRHDHCIAPRIVPVVEAMTAIVLADFMLVSYQAGICSKNADNK